MELLVEDAPATRVADAQVSEGEACSLENYLTLPDNTMDERIAAARKQLGKSTILLGHHYQRDEVIRFADYTGDSYRLSKISASTDARYVIFCGVHFMAESADVLGKDGQQVILPDLNAGCSMADMAEISQVEDCWQRTSGRGQSHSADLHELRRGHQGLLRRARWTGLHLFKRSSGIRLGI
jgi:quinolinate synthase